MRLYQDAEHEKLTGRAMCESVWPGANLIIFRSENNLFFNVKILNIMVGYNNWKWY